ncbi:hypothetical protein [Stenotrophomonas cyclobalanopsidis]|uniref:hypothetical protein n=1 Tax=Stenotrophomonas cyclobalanopsidis TaxID=2771362 RepID=UPI00345F59FD
MNREKLEQNLERVGLRLCRTDEATSQWIISPSNGHPYPRKRTANLREANEYFRSLAAHRLFEIGVARTVWKSGPLPPDEEQHLTNWATGRTSVIPNVIRKAIQQPDLSLPKHWMQALASHSKTFGCAASFWLHAAVLGERPK